MSRSSKPGGRTWRSRLTVPVAFVAMVVGGVGIATPANAAGTTGKSPTPSLAASGIVKIINNVSGKCVEVTGGSTREGARIQQWGCGGDIHRQWVTIDLGNGFAEYANRNSGLCLTAVWGTVNVTQTLCNTTEQRQWWRWLPANAFGDLVLANPTPWGDSCLALQPFSWVDGRVIGIADCATTSAQLWHPEAV